MNPDIVTLNEKNIKRFANRRGRNIAIDCGDRIVMWKYTIGKRGAILAYSEFGHRVMGESWMITGYCTPDTWSRDINRNHSTYASVTPRIVSNWLVGLKDEWIVSNWLVGLKDEWYE
jgi:hypothetical protein